MANHLFKLVRKVGLLPQYNPMLFFDYYRINLLLYVDLWRHLIGLIFLVLIKYFCNFIDLKLL